MLTKESFIKGIKDLRAVFGLNPEKETLEIWFRHLSKLDDKYFLAGISLMAENEPEFYPNTNIMLKIKSYAQMAREKELTALDRQREEWEQERYNLICKNQQIKQIEKYQRLINRRPDLEEILKKVMTGKSLRRLDYAKR